MYYGNLPVPEELSRDRWVLRILAAGSDVVKYIIILIIIIIIIISKMSYYYVIMRCFLLQVSAEKIKRASSRV